MGFGSFISGIVKNKVSTLFEEWKEEGKTKALDEIAASKVAQGLNAFGTVTGAVQSTGLLSVGMKQDAISFAKSELEFGLKQLFAPILGEFYNWQGNLQDLFGAYYLRNRAGGLIGETLGGIGGFIAGFFLPGGPILWSNIFSWLGGFVGPFIQEFGTPGGWDHPDIPGSPGDTSVNDGIYVPPDHDPSWFYPTETIVNQKIQTPREPGTIVSSRYIRFLFGGGHII